MRTFMSSEIYTDSPRKSQRNSILDSKQTVSLQGTHHRILDSLPALVRNRKILPLTPEYVTIGVGKTPAFRSTKPCETWHPSHEECPSAPSKGL